MPFIEEPYKTSEQRLCFGLRDSARVVWPRGRVDCAALLYKQCFSKFLISFFTLTVFQVQRRMEPTDTQQTHGEMT